MDIQNLTFRQLRGDEQVPYDLLLLADPSKAIIEAYLAASKVFVAEKDQKVIGAIVLSPLTNIMTEIKNVAVTPELQGQGVGTYLIENAIQFSIQKGYKSICIGTANSSVGQLYLYQKLGFEMNEIKKDFFIDNYPEPIHENGIRAKHMIVLTRLLEEGL